MTTNQDDELLKYKSILLIADEKRFEEPELTMFAKLYRRFEIDFLVRLKRKRRTGLGDNTIILYFKLLKDYIKQLEQMTNAAEIIAYMNLIIERKGSMPLYCALKNYFLFRYVGSSYITYGEVRDKRIKKLLQQFYAPKQNASMLTSQAIKDAKVPSVEELVILLEEVKKISLFDYTLIKVIAQTGCRESEVVGCNGITPRSIRWIDASREPNYAQSGIGAEVTLLGKGDIQRKVFLSTECAKEVYLQTGKDKD